MAGNRIMILLGLLVALVAGVAFLFERRLVNMEIAFLDQGVVKNDSQKEIADRLVYVIQIELNRSLQLQKSSLDKHCSVIRDDQKEIVGHIVSIVQMEMKKYEKISTSRHYQEQSALTQKHLEKLKVFFTESVIENSFQLQKAFLDKRCDVIREDQKEIAERISSIVEMEMKKYEKMTTPKHLQEQTPLTQEHLEKLKVFFTESVIEGSFQLQKAFLDKGCDVKRDDQKEIVEHIASIVQTEMKKCEKTSTPNHSLEQTTLTQENLEKLKMFFKESVIEDSFQLQKAFLDKCCDVKRNDQKEIAERIASVLQTEMKKYKKISTPKHSQEQIPLSRKHLEKLKVFFTESIIESNFQLQKALLNKRCDVKRDDQKEMTNNIVSVLQTEMNKYRKEILTSKPSQEQTHLTPEQLEEMKTFSEESVNKAMKSQNSVGKENTESRNPDIGEIREEWFPWLSRIYVVMYRIALGVSVLFSLVIITENSADGHIKNAFVLYLIISPFGVQPSILLSTFLPINIEKEYAYIYYCLLGPYRLIWAFISFQVITLLLKERSYYSRDKIDYRVFVIPIGIFMFSGVNAYAMFT